MALKTRICTVLDRVKTNFGCATPQTVYKSRACTAINASYTALGCGVIEPPQGCDITGCMSPTTYCDPVSKACTKQPVNGTCTSNEECQSGYCNIVIFKYRDQ